VDKAELGVEGTSEADPGASGEVDCCRADGVLLPSCPTAIPATNPMPSSRTAATPARTRFEDHIAARLARIRSGAGTARLMRARDLDAGSETDRRSGHGEHGHIPPGGGVLPRTPARYNSAYSLSR
jgi:hypothetical protein